jgi:hypothetical protein
VVENFVWLSGIKRKQSINDPNGFPSGKQMVIGGIREK